MKTKEQFIQLCEQAEKRLSGHFFSSDRSCRVPETRETEVWARPVFDLPISGKKRIQFSHNGTVQETILRPGDVLFTPAGVWKRPVWDLPHELFCFVVDAEYLRFTYVDYRVPNPSGQRPLCTNFCHTFRPGAPVIRDLVHSLSVLASSDSPMGSKLLLTRSILRLGAEILKKDQPFRGMGKADRTCRLLLQYLAENYARPVTRKDAAEYFHLNPCYISRLLREQQNKGFSQILREYRMEHALFLLNRKELLMDEIAMLCGYSSTQTFTTLFRQRYGLPPGRYREEILHGS